MSGAHLHPQAGAEHWGPSLGPVVLDIGGDIGAAVVIAPTDLEGAEIEIRRPSEPWEGRHVAVRSRSGPGGATFAAVFGGLPDGPYELRVRGGDAGNVQRVVVRGGDVAWFRWADSRSSETPGTPGAHAETHTHRGKEHSHAG